MEIKILTLGHIQVNCYLVEAENAALVIDPGFKSKETEEFLLKNSDKERLILLTHSHFDHIGAAESLREATDTRIAIGEKDNFALSNESVNLSLQFHAHISPFSADILLSDNDEIEIGGIKIKIIETPGHTVGGVSYLIDNVLFSGDTLFNRSVGRTDFPGGDFATLKASICKLFELDDSTVVLSGHGPKTTISYEKQHNPYV